jgi:hypothetical protein
MTSLDEGFLEEMSRPDGVYYQATFMQDSRIFEDEKKAMNWLDNKRHSIQVTPEAITAWASLEVERARALGMRLIQHQNPKDLLGLEPLGIIEERITSWAIENPMRARLLMIKLAATLVQKDASE